jgi:hypothetical protein
MKPLRDMDDDELIRLQEKAEANSKLTNDPDAYRDYQDTIYVVRMEMQYRHAPYEG